MDSLRLAIQEPHPPVQFGSSAIYVWTCDSALWLDFVKILGRYPGSGPEIALELFGAGLHLSTDTLDGECSLGHFGGLPVSVLISLTVSISTNPFALGRATVRSRGGRGPRLQSK